MPVKLSDVARVAGVHPATVSRALNEEKRHRLSEKTVAKVLQAAELLGYAPNVMAQGLAQGKSTSLGVLIGDVTTPLFPPFLRGVDDVVSGAGYVPLVVNTYDDPDREKSRLRALEARRVEGLIVATASITEGMGPESYTAVAPTVFALRAPQSGEHTRIVSDDATGIHELVAHLVELGHTRIAHITGPQYISTAVIRLRAYREALFEHGLEYDPQLVVGLDCLKVEFAMEGFGRLLDSGVDFTAVVAFNDVYAFGAYRALRARGLQCPVDISVTGFGDTIGSDLVDPPLTTTAVDHYEMGRQTAGLMLDMLKTPPAEYHHRAVMLPVSAVIRESTAPPRGATPSTPKPLSELGDAITQ